MFIKVLLTTLLPKLLNDAYEFLSSVVLDVDEPVKKKEVDRTKFTQAMYDFAIAEYALWQDTGVASDGNRYTNHKDFVGYLNLIFGTHKSISSMRRLYKGEVCRDTLPKGKYIYSSKIGEMNK